MNADVLDCACGTGYGSLMLARAGARMVTAVDLSEDAVDYARRTHSADRVAFRVDDACTLASVPANSFDVVTSFETIEHVPDDRAFVRQVARVLRPCGQFLVSTPDFRLGGLRQRLTGKVANPFHVREYTLAQLVRLCDAEFTLEERCGQMPVRAALVMPAIELLVKGIAYGPLKRLAASRVHDAYHPHDAAVTAIGDAKRWVPNFWVLRLRKR